MFNYYYQQIYESSSQNASNTLSNNIEESCNRIVGNNLLLIRVRGFDIHNAF